MIGTAIERSEERARRWMEYTDMVTPGTPCARRLLVTSLMLNVIFCIIFIIQFQRAVHAPVETVAAVSHRCQQPTQPSTNNNASQYWSLAVLDRGKTIDCQIATHRAVQEVAGNFAQDIDNKIMIHIHGMHHSGTGYLRKTLRQALNNEFSPSAEEQVACMQDSLLPYRHLYKDKRQMQIDHRKVEDEGQHLQSMYPSFHARVQAFKEAEKAGSKAPKMAYLADYCLSDDDTENKQIGNMLLEQWSRFWNITSSTTFLLQKTPSLDVQFLESTKIMPTFHVIIVRHPMASNSWGLPNFAYGWTMAYHHVFKLLNEGKVEWYAVVTYEALLEYHDVVVEELMEIVRSGMKRYGVTQHNVSANHTDSRFLRRQLRFYAGIDNPKKRDNLWLGEASNSYLMPKAQSIEYWRKCLANDRCREVLESLTTDILPFIGYVSIQKSEASLVDRINHGNATISRNVPLSVDPSPVTVSKEYGHVLFSSQRNGISGREKAEGQEHIGQPPPADLVVKMKELLETFAVKPQIHT